MPFGADHGLFKLKFRTDIKNPFEAKEPAKKDMACKEIILLSDTWVDDDFFEAVPISDKVNKVANMTADIQARINLNESAKAGETKTPKIVKPSNQMKLF